MINKQFIKYLAVGVMNTIVGYGVIFSLMYIGKSPEFSNITGYIIGISVSYILNRYFTFNDKNNFFTGFLKFVLSMAISYILNFITLIYCIRVIGINPYLSQLISGVVYTISGFLFSKYFAFRGKIW